MSVLKLTYDDAIAEYKKRSASAIGKLIADRELPVLHFAKEIIAEKP